MKYLNREASKEELDLAKRFITYFFGTFDEAKHEAEVTIFLAGRESMRPGGVGLYSDRKAPTKNYAGYGHD